MDDLISRQTAIEAVKNAEIKFTIKSDINFANYRETVQEIINKVLEGQEKALMQLPSAIVRCKDCKHNPKDEWFGCPMAHLNERQRPETAWCWKGERRNNE